MGNFFDNIGLLVDTDDARAILEVTYTFPDDTDPLIKLLYEEVAYTYASMPKEELATCVKVKDFQFY